jgi:hypothetical protein
MMTLECALSDHFPVYGCEKYFDQPVSYEKFMRAAQSWATEYEFRAESHLFRRIECKTGYLKLQVSINHIGKEVQGMVEALEGNSKVRLDYQLQHVELIATTEKRRRFIFHAVFRSPGRYRLALCDGQKVVSTFFVDNLRGTTEIPFLRYTIADSGFIPIIPTEGLTKVSSGFVLIRFAIKKELSTLWMIVKNSQKEDFPENAP